jgi:UDP-N-acetylglucosamine diphosphorylase / glucose-1-phosphate thymidylyltransferase / UDP-N-acetylgalactosamine diphosphorylase / glucosamine-1-phosphate N-acetyltransferase / galactosamine-1-phosphate N-acetyltransferase
MLKPEDFFDLTKTEHAAIFEGVQYVWEVLPRIKDYIKEHLKPQICGDVSPLAFVGEQVYIGPGTVIEPGAMIKGPAIIGADCEVRGGAYIRENVIVGEGSVVGHTSEVKNSLLFNESEVPHFAYVGDSVLGWKAHLGAGVKLSNVKINRSQVVLEIDGQLYETGLRKFGAILGDQAEIGCNAVLNPGTLVGKRTLGYANISMFGYYPPDHIVKLRQVHEIIERRKI